MEHTPRKLLQTSVIPLRWGDMDALGHVNNTLYFRYMEQTRVEWLDRFDPGLLGAGEGSVVIVHTSCSFFAPLVYPGDVEVRMFAEAPGRSSMQTHYEMRKVGEDKLYAEGSAKMVWIDLATGKSAPWPKEILANL